MKEKNHEITDVYLHEGSGSVCLDRHDRFHASVMLEVNDYKRARLVMNELIREASRIQDKFNALRDEDILEMFFDLESQVLQKEKKLQDSSDF